MKVLIVCTSANELGGSATGLWAEELAAPYLHFKQAGYEVTIASTKGGDIPCDATSMSGDFYTEAAKKFFGDDACKQLVKSSVALEQVKFGDFDAVFIPGGHGACVDFPNNQLLIQGLQSMLQAGKVVGSVCHGPMAFVNLKTGDQPVVKGKKITCFTDSEERGVGKEKLVPFLLESKLKELGAQFECAPDWNPHAVRDGNLVTGQNPMSSLRTAELMVEALKK